MRKDVKHSKIVVQFKIDVVLSFFLDPLMEKQNKSRYNWYAGR